MNNVTDKAAVDKKCLDAEMALCVALGWEVVVDPEHGALWHAGDTQFTDPIPYWCHDSSEAFKLMTKYDCYPERVTSDEVVVGWWSADGLAFNEVGCKIADLGDKETAVRFAVVQAVTAQLTELKA